MYSIQHLKEGYRIFKRSRHVKKHGFKKYEGNLEEICTKIVKECWNGTFFQTSAGHFSVYYIRDFCICIPGLIKLGYRKEILKTLQYALNLFSNNRKITTTISKENIPVHMHHYSPDSLPLLLKSLRLAKANELIEIYKPFLEEQIDYYYENVLDYETNLVRYGRFSSMKDNAKRKSSCYDNCMMAMLSDELDNLKLKNPFKHINLKQLIKDKFWNGRYFFDDLTAQEYVAGDANTFPFWCEIFDDEEMFNSVLKQIKKNNLDKPWPLKYTSNFKPNLMFPLNIILPDYETDTNWMHLGLCYMDVVKKFDKKLFDVYIKKYTQLIVKNKNFLEIFNPDGSHFFKTLYVSDESMLWSAYYLDLIKK
jgi:hypothetical protein